MVKISNLKVLYGKEEALKSMSLDIEKASTYAIIGTSGCGKTTLLYSIAGLISISEGTISINGEELKEIRKSTGVILQNYGLLPWKTVWKNIELGLESRKVPKEKRKIIIEELLEELELIGYKDKYPIQLSGGQKQRVAIGRTLALNPDLLLMDEPTSALDAITKEKLQNLILKIHKDNPVTMIIVTHNIEEAVFLGQKIVIMGKGYIKQIIDNPYFGNEQIRKDLKFYEVCLQVREALEGGEYEENN